MGFFTLAITSKDMMNLEMQQKKSLSVKADSFSLSSIREQDALKYADTGVKVTLKVRTPSLRKSHQVQSFKFTSNFFRLVI